MKIVCPKCNGTKRIETRSGQFDRTDIVDCYVCNKKREIKVFPFKKGKKWKIINCPECYGKGEIEKFGQFDVSTYLICNICKGFGKIGIKK